MSGRYEIALHAERSSYMTTGGNVGRLMAYPVTTWHATLWNGRTGKVIGEYTSTDREDALRQASEKRAEMEQADKPDINSEQAVRFARVFLDVLNSVNKSNDQMAAAFAFADVLETNLKLAKRGRS